MAEGQMPQDLVEATQKSPVSDNSSPIDPQFSDTQPPKAFTCIKPYPTRTELYLQKLTPAELKKIEDDIAELRAQNKKKRPFTRGDSINYQCWFNDTTNHRFPLTAPRRPPRQVPSGGRPFNPITIVHHPQKPKTKRQIIAEKIKHL